MHALDINMWNQDTHVRKWHVRTKGKCIAQIITGSKLGQVGKLVYECPPPSPGMIKIRLVDPSVELVWDFIAVCEQGIKKKGII